MSICQNVREQGGTIFRWEIPPFYRPSWSILPFGSCKRCFASHSSPYTFPLQAVPLVPLLDIYKICEQHRSATSAEFFRFSTMLSFKFLSRENSTSLIRLSLVQADFWGRFDDSFFSS